MLAAPARLRSSADFRATSKSGLSAGTSSVVVHARRRPAGDDLPSATRVGFVVSKAVGNAVVRNRVKRQLRHLSAAQLDHVPAGFDVVVRARPIAGQQDFAALQDDFCNAWGRAFAKWERSPKDAAE